MSTTCWQSLSKEIAAVSVRIKFTPMTVLTFACRVCVGCRGLSIERVVGLPKSGRLPGRPADRLTLGQSRTQHTVIAALSK